MAAPDSDEEDSGGARENNIEKDDENGQDGSGLNLTSFLFGNIDQSGQLEEEFLDESTRKQLGSLGSMLADTNLNNIVEEVSSEAKEDTENLHPDVELQEATDFNEKAPDAEDFSSIDEMLDVDSSDDDSDDEEKDKLPSIPTSSSSDPKNDSMLMPPPPPQAQAKERSPVSEKPVEAKPSGPIVAPLASMLPDKYKDVDVKEFFPEFKENSVLRFSQLFPIKESHKPRTWKALKKRRRKERGEEGEDGEPKEKKKCGWDYVVPMPTDPNAYAECQSVRFHKAAVIEKPKEEEAVEQKEPEKKGPKPTDWRWGPAQFWYDMLELPEEVPDYDYGLKVRSSEEQGQVDSAVAGIPDMNIGKKDGGAAIRESTVPKEVKSEGSRPDSPVAGPSGLCMPDLNAGASSSKSAEPSTEKIEFPPEAFHMVTQVNWEEDIIWNGEDIKHKVLSKLNSKSNAAGWVPSSMSRTAGSFSQRPGVKPELQIRLATLGKKLPENDDDTWYSIFPVENEELVYGRWEDEVIWDTENMPKKLEPRIVSLDPNDENIIIAIPDDIDPSTLPNEEPTRKIKIIQKHVKKSKLLLNRAGIISVVEEESPPPPPKNDDRDSFYIGNDEFYLPKEPASLIKVATGGSLLQHATPSVQLTAPFIPTHMGPIKLRQFHRWPIKRYSHGPLSNYIAFHGVQSLYKHQRKMEKWRTAEREEAGGGDIFLMREAKDLSGKDGDLVLFEYIEEYPPLIAFVGMCSKIKNYYKRKPDRVDDRGPKELKYGELTYAHTSPFLGTMIPGQTVQALENNMYRSPIYEHKFPVTDFIVIRTRTEFSIREVNAYFVTGQECPLYEVPGPNSKKANNFTRDFLQVFIYRLFWKSRDTPRRIKMDDIKKAFPAHSESSIRKRLKPCAEFHRTGPDSNWWVMKPGFRLPTEEEIRSMVDPEQCAAFYSMIAAEQRLKDSGYGDKFILAQEDDDNDDLKMDDEIKCAPWHTTRAYVQAMKGKCLLQLTGPADPTGPAQEGFSYVKIPNKPTNKEEQEAQPKRTVTGTDADLRKLPLKDAKAILRKNGVPEDEIKKLSRWEVIDVVRTLSTEKVKAGEEGMDSFKFSRGNRFSIAEHQERYREDCQRIFEVQNKVLASDEILSSDEAESSSEEEEEDEDLDELGKNLENMVQNKKTTTQFQREREEMERRKLQKVMMESKQERKMKEESGVKDDDGAIEANQVLRITRTFKNAQGKEYTRTELVRKSLVIETYVKVRNTKNEQFIRQFATMDDQVKEEMKKEKRRIQEQLRRIKRNQEKEKMGLIKPSKRKEKMKPDLKLKCGACNQVGHMRTNKACPKFTGEEFEGLPGGRNVAMTLEDEERMEKKLDDEFQENPEDLVNVEGTKVKFSEKILRHAEEIKRKSMQLKIPKDVLKSGKRRRAGTGKHCDYLDNKTYKPIKRRRTDPVITFSSYLETILNELRVMPEAEAFLFPVSSKAVTNYYEVIKRPMDLQTIRDNVQNKKYHSREEFLGDINQMVENSSSFNGEASILTINSKVIMDKVVRRFTENEERLMKLEKMINPLLDDNYQNALTYILDNILNEKIKTMQESWPFMKPVNKKQVKDYYEKIKQPMDLETISRKITSHKYHSREEFVRDMKLIYQNSLAFNGENSEFTHKAKIIVDTVEDTLVPFAEHCESLEVSIRETQQRALEQADLDSLGTSFTDDNEPKKKRKKKKHDISNDYIDVGSEASPDADTGDLMEDLQYSSEEDDDEWDEVEDSQDPSQGFTINVDQTALMDQQQQPAFDYYQGDEAVIPETPIFNIQAGANGELYAEPDPSMSFHPSQDPHSAYMDAGYTVDYSVHEEQVDENYDPTEFFTGLGGGMMGEQHVNGAQTGNGQSDLTLQDDLAVSDDSEDEKAEGEDDPMAF